MPKTRPPYPSELRARLIELARSGPIWGLVRGLWLPSRICIVGGVFTVGLVAVAYWLGFSLRGTYLYYSAYVKQKQLPVCPVGC